METVYRNIEIPLDNVIADNAKQLIDGMRPGIRVYGLSLVAFNFTDPILPAGAQVKLFFGQNEEIVLTTDIASFEFPCGHDDGVYFSNAAALAGKKIRILVDYSGFGVDYAR